MRTSQWWRGKSWELSAKGCSSCATKRSTINICSSFNRKSPLWIRDHPHLLPTLLFPALRRNPSPHFCFRCLIRPSNMGLWWPTSRHCGRPRCATAKLDGQSSKGRFADPEYKCSRSPHGLDAHGLDSANHLPMRELHHKWLNPCYATYVWVLRPRRSLCFCRLSHGRRICIDAGLYHVWSRSGSNISTFWTNWIKGTGAVM